MVQPIEVFLQPPSPTLKASFKLPSVKSLFPEETNSQELPSIRLTNHSSASSCSEDTYYSNDMLASSPRLSTIEPRPDLSVTKSPYQQSPIMSFSSPSSTTSSVVGSPLISPIQDGPFLLPPPNSSSFRRCRSVSNASNISSPCASPSYQFTFRSLSEPPTLNLPPPSSNSLKQDSNTTSTEDYHPIFGPKRKRGRPPNASRPEVEGDSNWTFVKPTVWDVKQNNLQQQKQCSNIESNNTFTDNHHYHTPQFYTENTVMSDGINTFTTTNMDMALSIPKKKRGRKPKKQLAGNSCFVWRDLTAPRGANKKSLLPKKKKEKKPDNV